MRSDNPVINVYKKNNIKSGVVTQLLYGDTFKKIKESGSWLKIKNDSNLSLTNWVALFKENFKFTGNEITKEFLTSTGYIKGAHIETCPILDK